MNTKDFFEELIPDEIDAFGEWAFGEELRELHGSLAFLDAWNKRHGGLLKLKPDGLMCEDAPKMIMLFRDRERSDG